MNANRRMKTMQQQERKPAKPKTAAQIAEARRKQAEEEMANMNSQMERMHAEHHAELARISEEDKLREREQLLRVHRE